MARNAGDDMGEVGDALRAIGAEARDAIARLGEELELDRRMRESPMAVLGIAMGAGFVLGGGLWPALRPFVKSLGRAALSPANLVAIAAAIGAMRAAGEDAGDVADEGMETH